MSSKSPLIRGFYAAVLALVLISPSAPALASSEATQLDRIKAELASIRTRLARAQGEARQVRFQVVALDRQISQLNLEIRKGEHEISSLESSIRSAEARIAELEARYSEATQASRDRARRLYKVGPTNFISKLFSVHSLSELAKISVWWQVTAELDGQMIISASRLKGELADQTEDLIQVRSQLETRKTLLYQRKGLIASARADRSSALSSLERDIAQQQAHVAALEKESRALTAALRSRMSRSTGAVSTSGFIWPLRGQVTSGYGYRRGGFHTGIDIDGNTGDPIVASKSGAIIGVACGSGYGICTIIDHGNGVATLYAHMSRKAVSGGNVERGQVIGYVGCTGSCTGSHLHFEVRVNGEPRNPMNFLP